jgi:hypothetical protein
VRPVIFAAPRIVASSGSSTKLARLATQPLSCGGRPMRREYMPPSPEKLLQNMQLAPPKLNALRLATKKGRFSS